MSLTNPVIPSDITRAFTTGLGDFVDPSNPLWSVMLNDSVALPAFNLQLMPDPVPPRPIALEVPWIQESGWRFVAAVGDLYGACHVGSIKPGFPPKLTGFSDDVQILTFVESFSQLRSLTEVAAWDFTPRVLRITWLIFEAFWLSPLPPPLP